MTTTPPTPNWSKAPEWAQWWAVDADGRELFFKDKPFISYSCWECMDGWYSMLPVIEIPLGIDWRTLIAERPSNDGERPSRDDPTYLGSTIWNGWKVDLHIGDDDDD